MEQFCNKHKIADASQFVVATWQEQVNKSTISPSSNSSLSSNSSSQNPSSSSASSATSQNTNSSNPSTLHRNHSKSGSGADMLVPVGTGNVTAPSEPPRTFVLSDQATFADYGLGSRFPKWELDLVFEALVPDFVTRHYGLPKYGWAQV